MGDMADALIEAGYEQMFDQWFEPYDHDRTCKYCGAFALHWEQINIGWRLHDVHGKIHNCTKYLTKELLA